MDFFVAPMPEHRGAPSAWMGKVKKRPVSAQPKNSSDTGVLRKASNSAPHHPLIQGGKIVQRGHNPLLLEHIPEDFRRDPFRGHNFFLL